MSIERLFAQEYVKHYIKINLTKIYMNNLQKKYPNKKFTFELCNK